MTGRQSLNSLVRIAVLLGAATACAFAGGTPPDVTVSVGGSTAGEAGRAVTLAFSVWHGGTVTRHVTPRAELPDGWRLAVPLSSFLVESGDRATRLLSVYIPSSTRAGDYEVRLILDVEESDQQVIELLPITVLPRFGLSLERAHVPRVVADGKPFTAHFILANDGNEVDTVHVRPNVDSPFDAHVEQADFLLQPGERRELEVTIRTASPLPESRTVMVHLTAMALGDPGRRARASASVQIVPVGSPSLPANALPAAVRASAVGTGSEVASQLEISTDDAGWGPFSFNVRLPQLGGTSQYRLQDYYHARYETERFSAVIGDDLFRVSPLLSTGRQSFGVAGTATAGRFTATGFMARSRHPWSQQSHQAVQVRYGSDAHWVSAGMLRARDGLHGEAVTLRGVVSPDASSTIDLELGAGTDRAARFTASGSYAPLTYHVEWLAAGRDFPGPNRGQEQRHARLALHPVTSLSVEARYSDFRYALGSQGTNRNMRSYRLSLRADGRRLVRGSSFRMAYSERSRQFGGIDPYAHNESVVEFGSSFARRGLFAATFLEIGAYSWDGAVTGSSPLHRITVQGSYAATRASADGQLELAVGPSINNPTASRSVAASLAGRLSLSSSITAAADLSITHRYGDRDLLLASGGIRMKWRLPTGGTLDVGVRNRHFDGFHEAASLEYTLSYTMPFGIPRPVRTTGPSVSGRLVDQAGRPVAGVLVQVANYSVMTDERGAFELPAPDAEVCFLNIDRLTLGFDRIPMVDMPLAIEQDRQDDDIVIPIAPTAVLRGGVERRDLASGDLPSMVIEISDGRDSYRGTTDRRGHFAFHDLRPGRWEVRVVGGDHDDRLVLDRERLSVDLDGGPGPEVRFTVRERDRMVRIIDRGTVSRR